MAGVKQRRSIANYLKIEEAFYLMGAGFTELNESPSAQTTSKRYVNDKSATKGISGYDWQTAFTTDIIASEKAIEHICNIGKYQLTGSDAETEYIIVDLDEALSVSEGDYRARKFNIAIEVADFSDEDGEMTASGNLLGIGDPVAGKFNTKTKEFVEGNFEYPPKIQELNITSAEGENIGDTKITVTPVIAEGNSYKYKLGQNLALPGFEEVCGAEYIIWDGTSDITATKDDKILIVEVNSKNRVLKAGIATVTVKEEL
ncbi:TPA: hypothetical protein ACG3PI_003478 [Clostridioides difficile]